MNKMQKRTIGILLIFFIIITAVILYFSYLAMFACDDSVCSFGEEIVCKNDCEKSSKKLPVMVQLEIGCNAEIENIVKEIKTDEFWIAIVEVSKEQAIALEEGECVIKTAKQAEFKKFLNEFKAEFEDERNEQFKKARFNRTRNDLASKEELEEILKKKHPEAEKEAQEVPEGGIMAPYQLYVTPDNNAIKEIAREKDGIEEVWAEALSWVWVSEQTLNGVEEKWLYPEEFLEDTPSYATNPVKGMIVSDCSEQANSLASLLIAEGYGEENVRVVLGNVRFDELNMGGHAWVQYFDGEEWIDMDATMGPYYDDEEKKLINVDISSIPYWYFKYYKYPAVEVWYYYNNKYFWDEGARKGNAPFNWRGSR
ncbi:hypothetical protein HZB88_01000 [archaeon]|nr:hypothetical protein [archaeon]